MREFEHFDSRLVPFGLCLRLVLELLCQLPLSVPQLRFLAPVGVLGELLLEQKVQKPVLHRLDLGQLSLEPGAPATASILALLSPGPKNLQEPLPDLTGLRLEPVEDPEDLLFENFLTQADAGMTVLPTDLGAVVVDVPLLLHLPGDGAPTVLALDQPAGEEQVVPVGVLLLTEPILDALEQVPIDQGREGAAGVPLAPVLDLLDVGPVVKELVQLRERELRALGGVEDALLEEPLAELGNRDRIVGEHPEDQGDLWAMLGMHLNQGALLGRPDVLVAVGRAAREEPGNEHSLLRARQDLLRALPDLESSDACEGSDHELPDRSRGVDAEVEEDRLDAAVAAKLLQLRKVL